jgi:hypothetical protein
MWREERERGVDLPVLTSPAGRQPRESSVLLFALMFHFGLGLALIGWVLITQEASEVTGVILLAVGIVAPILGVLGMVWAVMRRREYEEVMGEVTADEPWTAVPVPDHPRDQAPS